MPFDGVVDGNGRGLNISVTPYLTCLVSGPPSVGKTFTIKEQRQI